MAQVGVKNRIPQRGKLNPKSGNLKSVTFLILCENSYGIDATAVSASQRCDLIINYEKLSLEIAQYSKDGADILI